VANRGEAGVWTLNQLLGLKKRRNGRTANKKILVNTGEKSSTKQHEAQSSGGQHYPRGPCVPPPRQIFFLKESLMTSNLSGAIVEMGTGVKDPVMSHCDSFDKP